MVRYLKRRRLRRRFGRRKTGIRSKARRYNKSMVRRLKLQPKTRKYFDTGYYATSANHSHLWQLPIFSSNVTISRVLTACDPYVMPGNVIAASSEITTLADLKGKRIIVGKNWQELTIQNTTNHVIDWEFYVMTPRKNVNDQLFDDLSVTKYEWENLLKKLADLDDYGNQTNAIQYPTFDLKTSAHIMKYFKIVKTKRICQKTGSTIKVGLHGKKFTSLDGDLVQSSGMYQFIPGVFKFIFCRARGGLVHDTTNRALVSYGGFTVSYTFRALYEFFMLSLNKREFGYYISTDTLTTPEAPTRADIQMEEVKEE